MQPTKRGKGRPEVAPELRKRNRAISMTDSEYATLQAQASKHKSSTVSAYVVQALKLS